MPFSKLPRIYYIHPWLVGPIADWGPFLDSVAELGFDHVLVAPPFASGGSLFLTRTFEQLHEAVGGGSSRDGLSRLAGLCRARGLSLLLDLQLDRLARQSDLAAAQPGWFAQRGSEAQDPRVAPGDRGGAMFRMDQPQVADAALAFWSGVVQAMVDSGVGGFRFEGLATVPADLLRDLIAGAAGGAKFIASTPGLAVETVAGLAGCGFDAVVASTPWWDFRSPWLTEERERLRRVAPVLSMPEAPFGPRRAAASVRGQGEDAARRALWFAALEGDGLLLPMGFEFGAEDMLDAARGTAEDLAWSRRTAEFDLRPAVREANATLAADDGAFVQGPLRMLSAPGADVAVLLRTPGKAGQVAPGRIIVVNARLDRPATLQPELVLPGAGAAFAQFVETVPHAGAALAPGKLVPLAAGAVRSYAAGPAVPISLAAPKPEKDGVPAAMRRPRIAIEAVAPAVDGGRFAVKRTLGETVQVEADIFADGHDVLAAVVLWRAADEKTFREAPMRLVANDRWAGEFPLERMGRYVFAVEAWRDTYATFRSELSKKHAAGIPVSLEIEEGRRLVAARAAAKTGAASGLPRIAEQIGAAGDGEKIALLLSETTRLAMRAVDARDFASRTETLFPVDAERLAARFSSWYELFPRSQSGDAGRHGTFDDVVARLPAIRDMGFDTLYFPPIHPIGRKNRKGKNNTLGAGEDQPGSPYAIGAAEGGHDAVHPELGTLDDFRRLVAAAHEHGMELVLDFAIQCAPDHPWLAEHPDWFNWRPDGSIRYAENPPKKYEDIVNVDFYAPGALPALWLALRDVVLFWVEQGVRVFRVDNPHTKPLPFWEWMIGEVRGRYPDVIFLAEAFTRPKMMYRLAKIGFPQSYTYFTWRDEKAEIIEYLLELTTTAPRDFFRPHFFVNTPDINPVFLQTSGRPGFLIRAVLATTLSGLWGMYNGFELCEGRALPGKEEYLDSEKYEIVAWDYDRPGNIKAEITRLNQIRKANPALQTHLGVAFYTAANDRILFFGKRTPDLANFILVAVNLDPFSTQEAAIEIPLWEFGLPDDGAVLVDDLMADRSFVWQGKMQFVRLDPNHQPFFVFRIRPA